MQLSRQREAQLLALVNRSPEDCVRFADSAYVRRDGALVVHRDGGQEFLHRRLFRLARDPQLGRRVIERTCDTVGCVNPWHHETVEDEVARDRLVRHRATGAPDGGALNAAKTACPYNHPYDEENTYLQRIGHGAKRRCRQCARERRLGLV